MNIHEKEELVRLTRMAIRGEKCHTLLERDIDRERLLQIAIEHKVEGLIYTTLNNTPNMKNMDESIAKKWKTMTLGEIMLQKSHIQQISKVLQKFEENEIEVIVLKGLVVRSLYPVPDLRSMGDADILVHEKDLDRVGEVLLEMGYQEDHSTDAHDVYSKPYCAPVEVHWTLVSKKFYDGNSSFEKNLWQNSIPVQVGKANARALGWEDQILHSCVHMAIHLRSSGFGIRHVADLVLLVEAYRDRVDWREFRKRAEETGVYKFVQAIFIIAHEWFDMPIPEEIDRDNNTAEKTLKVLKGAMLDEGVYGKTSLLYINRTDFLNEARAEGDTSKLGLWKTLLRAVCPPADKLSESYAYAKRMPILLPVAWIHHIIVGIFTKDYSLKYKLEFFLKTNRLIKERDELLKKLEL